MIDRDHRAFLLENPVSGQDMRGSPLNRGFPRFLRSDNSITPSGLADQLGLTSELRETTGSLVDLFSPSATSIFRCPPEMAPASDGNRGAVRAVHTLISVVDNMRQASIYTLPYRSIIARHREKVADDSHAGSGPPSSGEARGWKIALNEIDGAS